MSADATARSRYPPRVSPRGKPQRHWRPPTCCWGNASIQSQYAVHAALVPSLERSRNVGYTLTVPPAVPKLGLLLRREPRPCVPLHTHPSSSRKIKVLH